TCSINRSFVLLLVHLHTIIYFFFLLRLHPRDLHSFPTRRSSDLSLRVRRIGTAGSAEPHDPRIRSLHWRDLARQPRHTPFKTGQPVPRKAYGNAVRGSRPGQVSTNSHVGHRDSRHPDSLRPRNAAALRNPIRIDPQLI